MAQQLNILGSEADLKELLDFLYLRSKEAFGNGKRPKFHGLLEVIFSEPVILSAIHKLKGNRGSNTPGSDGRNIRDAILERGYVEVVKDIQSAAVRYSPEPVRRVWIPKPGKAEKRPLGIPAIKDRIIQECIRMVIEPMESVDDLANVRPSGQVIMAKCVHGAPLLIGPAKRPQQMPKAA